MKYISEYYKLWTTYTVQEDIEKASREELLQLIKEMAEELSNISMREWEQAMGEDL